MNILIFGANGGIGKGFIHIMSQMYSDATFYLVSRTSIEDFDNRSTQLHVFELSSDLEASMKHIYEQCKQVSFDYCINAAGSYADKIARIGIRACDLRDEKYLKSRLEANYEEKSQVLKSLYGKQLPKFDGLLNDLMIFREVILKYLMDTNVLMNNLISQNKKILCEGAQGTMLDVDHGSYPFVTSSNSSAGGVCTGLGIPPTKIDRVLGVVKAYTTRVGEGPFPTELFDSEGEQLGKVGHEFGATTGRPRRCGWFDAVVAKYAIQLSGIDALILTKIDVLDGFKTIKVCTGYKFKGKVFQDMPADPVILGNCEPVYTEHEGWMEKTAGVKDFAKLPEKARRYIRYLSDLLETPFLIISTGPDREETIEMGTLFVDS